MKSKNELITSVQALLPFIEPVDESIIERFENSPIEQLERFYFFQLTGVSVSNNERDICLYLERQFQRVLSAAYKENISLLTAVIGTNLDAKIYIGFMEQSLVGEGHQMCKNILNGLIPGLCMNYTDTSNVIPFFNDKKWGGIISGIPILDIDGIRQRFSLPSVIRSLYGEEYTIIIKSEPIARDQILRQLQEVYNIQDVCHQLAKQSISFQKGESHSSTHGETDSVSHSRSTSFNINQSGSIGLFPFVQANGGYSAGISNTIQHGKNISKSETISNIVNQIIGREQQNSVAKLLEEITERFSKRFLKAINIGEWATTISFSTQSQECRNILAGTLLGELTNPSSDIFPPYVHYDEFKSDSPNILLPCVDNISNIFGRSLASYLTSEELAFLSSPPSSEVSGYEVRRVPTLSLSNSVRESSESINVLGTICDHGSSIKNSKFCYDFENLSKHLFVCGLTGSGKTTTVKEILLNCNVPFLVIESAKREYRQLIGQKDLRNKLNVNVYTIGNNKISPFAMNPFYIMPEVPPVSHIDYLKAIFNASFEMYGPMSQILEKCIYNIYQKWGWDLINGIHPMLYDDDGKINSKLYESREAEHFFPTISDLKNEVQDYVKSELNYSGDVSDDIRTALFTRLESLCVGAKGSLFNTTKPIQIHELLSQNTVLELEDLSDDDDKAFFVGLILTFISEYRHTYDPSRDPFKEKSKKLEHLLVIEEAHRLLKNVQQFQSSHLGNPRGKAVEFFANVISEMRSKGQGVVVVEQIPTKILPDVIKNTNTKIIHRIVSADDQAIISSTLGLEPNEALYLSSLKSGYALHHSEGMQRPLEILIKPTFATHRIGDEKIKSEMKTDPKKISKIDESNQISNFIGEKGKIIAKITLNSIIAGGEVTLNEVIQESVNRIKNCIIAKHLSTSEHAIKIYLRNEIVALLIRGNSENKYYDVNKNIIDGLSTKVDELLNENRKSYSKFITTISSGWNSENVEKDLVSRMCIEICEIALRENLNREDLSKLDDIAMNKFLVDIPNVRREIVNQVVKRLG